MISPRRQAHLGLIAAVVVLLIAVSIILAGSFEKSDLRSGLPGSPAIAFRLPDLQGRMLSLSSLRNNVVVLCFAPAPESAAAGQDVNRLAELGRHYAGDPSVKMVCIYSEAEALNSEQMHIVHQRGIDAGPRCTTLLDPASGVAKRYGIDQTPTFLIIDAAGIIRYRGGIDDSSPDAPLAATSFTSVVDLLVAEKPLPGQPTPAVLSNITK